MKQNTRFLKTLFVLLLIGQSCQGFAQTLDPSFNQTGVLLFGSNLPANPTKEDAVSVMSLQADGKILTAGSAYDGTLNQTDVVIFRIRPNGTLDASFQQNGSKVLSLTQGNDACTAMELQADGKAVLVVEADSLSGTQHFWSYIVRLDTAGNLDPTFGTGGKVRIDSSGVYCNYQSSAMTIAPDGKILVALTLADTAYYTDISILRFLPDGSPDSTFGVDGRSVIGFANLEDPRDILLLPDGRIMLAADTYQPIPTIPSRTDILVARLLPNGTPDSTFAGDGILTTEVGIDNDRVREMILQPDGKVVLAGRFQVGPLIDNRYDLFLMRVDPHGSLDSSFGNAGIAKHSWSTQYEHPEGLLLQQDGKLLMAAQTSTGFPQVDVLLLRWNADGSLDQFFANNGVFEINQTVGEAPMDMLFQPDGKLVIVGNYLTCGSCDIQSVAYRLLPDVFTSDEHVTMREDQLECFPNPFSDQLRIRVTPTVLPLPYTLYDVHGKVVQQGQLNEPLTNLDLSGLTTGMYYLRAEGFSTRKLVKTSF